MSPTSFRCHRAALLFLVAVILSLDSATAKHKAHSPSRSYAHLQSAHNELTRSLQDMYLSALRVAITGVLLETEAYGPDAARVQFDYDTRHNGSDVPVHGLTSGGLLQLEALQHMLEDAILENIKGDFVEVGVWRGGASIFAQGVMRAHGIPHRHVVLVDSFAPPGTPQPATPAAATAKAQKATRAEVELHFKRLGLLDKHVIFYDGAITSSLPRLHDYLAQHHDGRVLLTKPVPGQQKQQQQQQQAGASASQHEPRHIAVLKISSTDATEVLQVLFNLYPMVPRYGSVMVDHYHSHPGVKAAVDGFLALHSTSEMLGDVDGCAATWKKVYPFDPDMHWFDKFNSSGAGEQGKLLAGLPKGAKDGLLGLMGAPGKGQGVEKQAQQAVPAVQAATRLVQEHPQPGSASKEQQQAQEEQAAGSEEAARQERAAPEEWLHPKHEQQAKKSQQAKTRSGGEEKAAPAQPERLSLLARLSRWASKTYEVMWQRKEDVPQAEGTSRRLLG